MPIAQFNRANTNKGPEIPRLKLEKDEKARIVILDEGPQYRWQHRLEKIKFLGQRPAMVTRERQNGDTYEVFETDWIGSPACTGDPEVLAERGVDPDGCLMCAASRKYPDAFGEPQRRFSMNVFRYSTKPGTSEVQTPYGGQLLVWSFTEKRFSVLVDIAEEFGDLRTTDLTLGPCTNKQYQNFDVHGSPKAAWMATDETKKYTASMYRENKFSDNELMDMCAKLRETRYLKEDIELVIEAWEQAARWEQGVAAPLVVEPTQPIDVGDALADLFESAAAPEAEAPKPISRPTTSVTDDLDSLLSSVEIPDDQAVAEEAASKEVISGLSDLDDLLGG
jgi:hypothetical protein